jgi:hypothetical protein
VIGGKAGIYENDFSKKNMDLILRVPPVRLAEGRDLKRVISPFLPLVPI